MALLKEGCRNGLQQRLGRPDSHQHAHHDDGADLDGGPTHAVDAQSSLSEHVTHLKSLDAPTGNAAR